MTPSTIHDSPFTNFLTFAHELADVAGAIIRPYFGAHGAVESKGDESPVTEADREAEAAMRKRIEERYPDHAIYGEEFGLQLAAGAPLPAGEAMRLNDPELDSGAFSRSGEGDLPHASAKNGEGNSPSPTAPSPGLLPIPPSGDGSNPTSPARGEGPPVAPLADTTHLTYTWVIDPIDGTRAFIAGRKEWGTLIALCENGIPILGILDQPVTGERWVGMRGMVTLYFNSPLEGESKRSFSVSVGGPSVSFLNEQTTDNHAPHGCAKSTSRSPSRGELKCNTRPCARISDAELSTTSTAYFTPTQAARVVKLAQSSRATVKDGDCYAYGLLARGLRDIVIDAGLKPYDILALVPIIEGAGGKITGWDGAPVTLEHFREVIAAGDRALLNNVLTCLDN